MKRAGFTMIELIFVIVILGILSAVALPKFIGVSNQAKAGKCKAFVGTLNRTVLPTIWSDAVLNGADDTNIASYFSDGNLTAQITVPSECNASAAYGTLLTANTIATNAVTMNFGSDTYTVDINTTITVNTTPVLSFTKVVP